MELSESLIIEYQLALNKLQGDLIHSQSIVRDLSATVNDLVEQREALQSQLEELRSQAPDKVDPSEVEVV